jgi:hypothetical protein
MGNPGNDEVRSLDAPWTLEKVLLLLTGEAIRVVSDEGGRDHEIIIEGLTAFEQRTMAFDYGRPDWLLEVIQFEQAVASLRDRELRDLLMLVSRMGEDPHNAAELLRDLGRRTTKRDPLRMMQRGAGLIHRHERNRQSLLRRVRAALGLRDTPVCWRCLKVEVARIGYDCGDDCPALKEPGKPGPKRKFDPADPAPVESLSPEQRQAEIDHLVKTQDTHEHWPGQRTFERNEQLYGEVHPPEES